MRQFHFLKFMNISHKRCIFLNILFVIRLSVIRNTCILKLNEKLNADFMPNYESSIHIPENLVKYSLACGRYALTLLWPN